jgi:hypothetical protein
MAYFPIGNGYTDLWDKLSNAAYEKDVVSKDDT